MLNEDITTNTLLQGLFKTASITRFIKHYGGQMKREPFSKYITGLCVEKGLVPGRVVAKSGIDRTYGHQLFSGLRKPSRDKVLQLAFGFEMDYKQTQDFLKTAGKSALYPKVERDAVLIYALNKRFTIIDVQRTLHELNMPLLGE